MLFINDIKYRNKSDIVKLLTLLQCILKDSKYSFVEELKGTTFDVKEFGDIIEQINIINSKIENINSQTESKFFHIFRCE